MQALFPFKSQLGLLYLDRGVIFSSIYTTLSGFLQNEERTAPRRDLGEKDSTFSTATRRFFALVLFF